MSRAIQLAKRGRYTCDPNPRVGCVICKEGQVIAEGWHAVSGEAHAEVNALNQCDDASDSTVYITLEPCSHHGRTPPCVDALINANVKEVIIAMSDPNPLVSGSGINKLEEAGIKVKQGLLEVEAIKLNPGFVKRMTLVKPYVRCKLAMSLDGRTALANGDSQWISSEQSRKDVHRLRAASSAILSTVETVISDDASLNARDLEFDVKQPVRVIIDRQLGISSQAKLFSIAGKVIIYTEKENDERLNELYKVGAEVIFIPASESWLAGVFTHLAKKYEINEVLVEAGATFSGSLIEAGLVDELVIYMAPILLGDTAQALLKLEPLNKLKQAKKLNLIDVRQCASDIRLTYSL
ncbi:MAG: bifunctional diaminohydroxyphosphoribosylaminopyrimidine deaminase/5-amino-6-(5-phosphoribosylamino)uracil reductase RibD [Proteobacteria bacterium]|nr:bifunctional diaminohydroxyphosphoribosylaminopyrimidine deaminase/5-amino-6-(5-phosphoribosylamino)uracil reductase RibD [Pseudomonadota bacterium]NOG61326.1 bifunctional diaminohydroxyphosphoribosylaminopyrimidine deaminase/5-amino-6-(5-phosphoribosylamino)uracil reductase RibD [Pseudomonadota bacterium]